jgi:hypothetical protein
MNNFPTIPNPDYPLDEETDFPAVRTQFENGATQSRPKFTRGRDAFTLRWTALAAAHLATLKAFFLANQGAAFSWTHPQTAASHTVRFRDDTFKRKLVLRDHYTVELTLEEV